MTLTEDEIAMMTQTFDRFFLQTPAVPQEHPGSPSAQDDPQADPQTPGGDGHARPPGHARPGPLRDSEGSLGQRHMAHHTARVLAGVQYAKIFPMQILYAKDAEERDALSRALLTITGLTPLLRDGRVTNCVVCWSTGRWPKHPTGIRVSLPGGEAERRRLLGGFEPHLRAMVAALLPAGGPGPRYRRPQSRRQIRRNRQP